MSESAQATAPERVLLRSISDRVEIAPGVHMPRLGLGTSQSAPGEVEHAIEVAFDLGYRLVDTATAYRNERAIGAALAATGVPRQDYFVTTKVWADDQGYRPTLAAFETSCKKLKLDYIDLYLIHWPDPPNTAGTWKAMEELLDGGSVRSIGVSNFTERDLETLFETARVMPAVDQFELHPLRQRPYLQDYCRENEITIEAWAPLMRGKAHRVPELVAVGERHGKTAAQVSIRWILQKEMVTVPKSVHAERIRENASVFDFELSPEEMAAIDQLDRDQHAR
ncbi:MAG TPA: aldo/keto reductase [Coriobacteriia bacterium]|nr:aldo/keto reductase [Coriobacteriia bacterium]